MHKFRNSIGSLFSRNSILYCSTALELELGGGRKISEFSTVRMLYTVGIQVNIDKVTPFPFPKKRGVGPTSSYAFIRHVLAFLRSYCKIISMFSCFTPYIHFFLIGDLLEVRVTSWGPKVDCSRK